jgi:hypothetical protein
MPSQVIQELIDEFLTKRKQVGRPRLRWRVSHGPRRSLGWIPFTNQDVEISGSIALFRGRKIRLWKHARLSVRRPTDHKLFASTLDTIPLPSAPTGRYCRRRGSTVWRQHTRAACQ